MLRTTLAILLGATIALVCGLPSSSGELNTPRGVLVERVLGTIERKYVVQRNIDVLFEEGLDLMVRQLDPNTRYIPPSEVEEFDGDTDGYYVGIGVVLAPPVDEYPTIQTVIRGGPAEAAGLVAGDTILRIAGENVRGFSMSDLKELLQGENGSVVTLTIRRANDAPREVAVTHARVSVSSITAVHLYEDPAWPHAIGYLRIAQFQNATGVEMQTACENVIREGAGALVVDLRRNGGGILEEGLKVARLFLRDGVILRTRARHPAEDEVYEVGDQGPFPDIPLAVLIDGGSASAAEFVAAAFQDHDRALIIGEPSFGKWTLQTVIDLGKKARDGKLKLTTSSFHRPNERRAVIGRDGKHRIQPHVLVETDAALADALEAKWIDEQIVHINDPLMVTRQPAPRYDATPPAGAKPEAGADGVLIRALAILAHPGDYEKLRATAIPEIAVTLRRGPRTQSDEPQHADAETTPRARDTDRRP